MNGFDLLLFVVKTFLLSHAALFALVFGGAGLVLSIVFLGTGPAILTFLRSRIGQVIVALILAGAAGWELRGYVDDTVALQRQLAGERREAERALAEQTARTKAALALADAARRQAEDQKAVAAAAARNEADARAAADASREEADDYADELQDAKRHPPRERAGFALRDADVRGLRGIGAASGSHRP